MQGSYLVIRTREFFLQSAVELAGEWYICESRLGKIVLTSFASMSFRPFLITPVLAPKLVDVAAPRLLPDHPPQRSHFAGIGQGTLRRADSIAKNRYAPGGSPDDTGPSRRRSAPQPSR